MVVFVAIDPVANWRSLNNPGAFLLPRFWGNYYQQLRRLADEMGVVFVDRALQGIWGNRQLLLPNDPIHPNVAGHQLLTDRVYEALKPHLPGAGSAPDPDPTPDPDPNPQPGPDRSLKLKQKTLFMHRATTTRKPRPRLYS